jgi:malate permease and related proteins
MMIFQILTDIILPVFVLIGIGALADRLLPIDLGTLAKLSFYVFIAATVFIKLLDSRLDPVHFGVVTIFSLIHMLVLMAVGWQVFKIRPFFDQRAVLVMGAIFYNSGNFGIPFAQLAFGDVGVSVMTILLMVQLIATFTIGLWLVGVGRGNWKALAEAFLKSPVIYMIAAALLLNAFHIELPRPIYQSIRYLADGLIPVALLTLGVQLSRSKAFGQFRALASVSLTRLVLSPLLAWGMVAATGLMGAVIAGPIQELAPILITSAGLPVAVNVYILSVEYQQDAALASHSIFWTTLLSAATLTAWLLMV